MKGYISRLIEARDEARQKEKEILVNGTKSKLVFFHC